MTEYIIGLALIATYLFLFVGSIAWVYLDARRRTNRQLFWALAVFVFWIPSLLAYLYMRGPLKPNYMESQKDVSI